MISNISSLLALILMPLLAGCGEATKPNTTAETSHTVTSFAKPPATGITNSASLLFRTNKSMPPTLPAAATRPQARFDTNGDGRLNSAERVSYYQDTNRHLTSPELPMMLTNSTSQKAQHARDQRNDRINRALKP
jgi:hypothetical protein